MQRSFSIVDEDENIDQRSDEEQISKKYDILTEMKNLQNDDLVRSLSKIQSPSDDFDDDPKPPTTGISGRQTVLRTRPLKDRISTDSDDSDIDEKNRTIPGEYDSKLYEDLDVSPDIKEIFQYITKYIPQQMTLDHKFKPFVPEFLPAVGDIDAFLKVVPPAKTLSGENFVGNEQLGLVVLDEPSANQSDAALLHLQLRAESVKTTHDNDVVVKKVDNIEKNVKVIDKWIKDISALHKSKSFPAVRYNEPMPDLDELMQEWSEEMEQRFKNEKFPGPKTNLKDYIEEICGIFGIPAKNKIHALHLFFSLYASVKSSQLFKNSQISKDVTENEVMDKVADQLVLE